MQRHLSDHQRQPTPSRLRHYLAIQRAELQHPAMRALRNKQAEGTQARRTAEYLRIARGYTV